MTAAPAVPERTCILSGAQGTPETLLRLALGPEGQVGADFAARLPGRGAWVSLDRAALEAALAKGRLKGLLARAFKLDQSQLALDPNLPAQVAAGLQARALARLGLEKRAGHIVSGADQVDDAVRTGKAQLLIHAGDAAPDGMRKLGSRTIDTVQLPCGRDEIGLALGRDAVVHVAVIDPAAARRCLIDIRRWLAYGAPSSARND